MPEIKLTAAEIALPGEDMSYASFDDRATAAAIAILQIITDAELEPNLEPGELQCWLWRYLRDEFDDIAGGLQA